MLEKDMMMVRSNDDGGWICLKDFVTENGGPKDPSSVRKALKKNGVELTVQASYFGGPKVLYFRKEDAPKVLKQIRKCEIDDRVNASNLERTLEERRTWMLIACMKSDKDLAAYRDLLLDLIVTDLPERDICLISGHPLHLGLQMVIDEQNNRGLLLNKGAKK
jgi:hypothetical protein